MERRMEITLKRSPIGRPGIQRKILTGLGLKRLHQTVVRKDTPEIRGMMAKIIHLIEWRELSGEEPGQ